MEDYRAHDRLDTLEAKMVKLAEQHSALAGQIRENTVITVEIKANTEVIVDLVRGAKGVRNFIVWITPVIAIGLWVWHLISGSPPRG